MNTFKTFFSNLGEQVQFVQEVFKTLLTTPFEKREFITQLSEISWRSTFTTSLAGLFTGAILGMQFYLQIKDYGAEVALGGLNTSGTLREVGPLLIAFMLSGKVGAFTSAELATMKVTDQVNALRCLGINPISFLILPRFLAVSLSAILLLSMGLVISVVGGMLTAFILGDVYPVQYLSMIPRFAGGEALGLALLKAVFFGILMGHLCCWNGMKAEGGTESVGEAVKKTAVQSMVAVVLADFIISLVFSSLLKSTEWFQ